MRPRFIVPTSLIILWLTARPGFSQNGASAGAPPSIETAYRAVADSLIHAATSDSAAYLRLGNLVDGFGHRLSGSANLEAAIDWVLEQMKGDGLENVRGDRVLVPHWVRGEESAELMQPRRARLRMLGLGGSVATPRRGITAPVLVVTSFTSMSECSSSQRLIVSSRYSKP